MGIWLAAGDVLCKCGSLLSKITLSNVLHLGKDHCAYFFGSEGLRGSVNIDFDDRFVTWSSHHLEGKVLDICLNLLVREAPPYESFYVEYCVGWVACELVLGCVTCEWDVLAINLT